jgi:GNAT superfamily N-acetyltransferase
VTQPGLRIGDGDPDLDARLSKELDALNVAASGVGNLRELTVQSAGRDGELLGGLSGWTWGTCAGVAMLWVREDQRRNGLGRRLLLAAEEEAHSRGCTQILVSSFTFQAPDFYKGLGYSEFARTERLPTEGSADVHMVKLLTAP